MTRDLTKGKITRTLLVYSLPMMISIIFQQLYSISDSIIVGKIIGEDALAAVTASTPINMILIAVATGFSIGSSVVISQLFGAKDITGMKTSIYTALLYSTALSAALVIIGLSTCVPMLSMLNTPTNIIEDSVAYLNISIVGFAFLMVYNTCNGIFTALGNSRLPLYFLIGSSTLNVALDLVFVAILDLGVEGVAWATFIAQGTAMGVSLIVLLINIRKIMVDTSVKPKIFSLDSVKELNRFALPSVLQQSFIAIGNLFVQGEINGYGESVIAGYGSAVKLNTFAIMSINTLGSGISSFTAQNFGAKKFERIEKGYKTGILIVCAIVTPFVLLFLLFGAQFVGFFMDEESKYAISVGANFLRIAALFYYVVAVKIISDSLLRGSGSMKSFVIATFADLLLRVISLYILSYATRNENWLWAAWPIGWSVSVVISFIYAARKIKSMKSQVN